jgi:CheY-like chemotaxis protein/DNA-directed RNA polymerase specialized sigma24 family protein
MSDKQTQPSLSVRIGALLPYLRRYARALTGDQTSGDRYAAATLEALLEDRSVFEEGLSERVALFKAFHMIWSSSGAPLGLPEKGIAARAQRHLSRLTENTREALLLKTIESFTIADIAAIMNIDVTEADHLVKVAMDDMAQSLTGRVMIIEDEAIIALDLQSIVADMGHKITGVAATRTAATDLFDREAPDLILSDIQLADGSSGIDAVNDIMKSVDHIPVIFITAFPERLLTGERPEPAFVITKPYSEEQIRSAVSQAMFFSSTETLKV